jgi:hypothetical protein
MSLPMTAAPVVNVVTKPILTVSAAMAAEAANEIPAANASLPAVALVKDMPFLPDQTCLGSSARNAQFPCQTIASPNAGQPMLTPQTLSGQTSVRATRCAIHAPVSPVQAGRRNIRRIAVMHFSAYFS